jgi:subtilisin family serine protease
MAQADQALDQGVTGFGVKVCVSTIPMKIFGQSLDWVAVLQRFRQRDGHSHGTHISATIAAAWNNGRGVVGVALDAEIYTVRHLGDDVAKFMHQL